MKNIDEQQPEADIDFSSAMTDVTPLVTNKTARQSNNKADINLSSKRQQATEHKELEHFSLDLIPENSIKSEQLLSYKTDGIQDHTFTKLKQAQLGYSRRLDLHGYRLSKAETVLPRFIKSSQELQHQVVLIIHGKGNSTEGKAPVLKNHLNNWLRTAPEVLAFCSAQPQDGGAGALYVLLKKQC